MAYTSQYPTQDADHVKATSELGAAYKPYFTTDPTKSLVGASDNNAWISTTPTNQRFHIDLGAAFIIRRVYYENEHETGGTTERGCKTFTMWGSNSATAFAELTYGTDTNWTQLTIDDTTFDQHVALNQVDPKYIVVTNSVAYRYYAFKIADNWTDASYMEIRRIELQTEDGYVPPSGRNNSFAYFM